MTSQNDITQVKIGDDIIKHIPVMLRIPVSSGFFQTIMQYLKKMDSKIDKIGEEIKTPKEEIGTGMKGKGKKSEQENFHVPPKIRVCFSICRCLNF